ncbi:MAG: hypothetical protein IPH24_00685 [Crocinitomicaceae bacterium]|nr:hypothetical protein [Crocinitomicaceae bacterium]
MSNWLDKLGLSEDLSLKYYVRHEDFVEQMQKFTDSDQGLFSGAFDAFSSSKVDYRGTINISEFSIRKKKRLFDSLSGIPLISGTIQNEKNGTRLLVNVCAFTGILKYMFWLLCSIYIAAAIFLAFSGLAAKFGFMPFVFLLLHAILMFGVFYFMLRRSVSKVSENLDRDFKIMIQYLPELDPKQS